LPTLIVVGAALLCSPAPAARTPAPQVPPPGSVISNADKAKEIAAERVRNAARTLEQNSRTLTLFDRTGQVVSTLAERHIFNQPVLSPDRTRVAVIKPDLVNETADLWVYDLATSRGLQITSTKPRENVQAPAWSPDARHVAYVSLRGSRYNIYRKPSDGSGQEELLYSHEGTPIVLTDWSLDGRYMSFYASDLGGSTLYLLPVDGDRKPFEVVKSEKEILGARLSPDSRLLAYRSDETGRNETWVRSVPPPGTQTAKVDRWQISTDGGYGMVWWRRDGRELYYFGPDRTVMAVDITPSGASFTFSKPRPMFQAPASIPPTGNPGAFGSASRDGERFVFAVPPVPPLRQLTVFDRQGNVMSRIGAPGIYVQPTLAPDGTKLAVMRTNPQNGDNDIWVFDVATGTSTAVTSDDMPETSPVWYDNTRVAYVSMRNNFASIYRKAWNGTGAEEQLFRYTAGAGLGLTDFSPDGKFAMVDGGAIVLSIPLSEPDPLKREAVDFARSEFEAGAGRFSPDGRLVAFGSNDTGRFEVYVRPFNAATGEASGERKWQVSNEAGVAGGINWRQDGQELFYVVNDNAANVMKVMAVEITASPEFTAKPARELFRLPGPLPGNPPQWKHVSADGQRFVFAVPVSPAR
jgi:Tol biopolymer transport system component